MTKNPAKKNEKKSQRRKGKEIEKKSPEEPKHLRFKGVGPKSGEAPEADEERKKRPEKKSETA